ncbi:MAG: DUF2167 domain-containing protein [Hyphomicrobiaceae bacterium]
MTIFLLSGLQAAEAKTFKEMFPADLGLDAKEVQFLSGLDYKQGEVDLGSGGVVVKISPQFYFLGAADARRVLVDAWGNRPTVADGVLGIIFPADRTPLDETWGAALSFDEDGYVSDDDAASIDYDALLKEMQEGTEQENAERAKEGFESIKLIGWASPPFYDSGAHLLHWAKELEFGGDPQHTLNYYLRALGRHGVLNVNFIASMSQLDDIKRALPIVLAMPDFKDGSRYADYVPGADKVAAYGIGGLIAGKLAAKAGLLALALAFLKKGFVLVIAALAAVGGLVRRLFGRKQEG